MWILLNDFTNITTKPILKACFNFIYEVWLIFILFRFHELMTQGKRNKIDINSKLYPEQHKYYKQLVDNMANKHK